MGGLMTTACTWSTTIIYSCQIRLWAARTSMTDVLAKPLSNCTVQLTWPLC
jgi:hypothetical protein